MSQTLEQLNEYAKVDVKSNRGSGHRINRDDQDVLVETLKNEINAWFKIGREIEHSDGELIINKEKTQDDDTMVKYDIVFDSDHELAGKLDQHLLNVFSGIKKGQGQANLFVML